MSKDPLEELFGPGAEQPQPVPARERLAQEQAERVRTAQLSMDQREPKRSRSNPAATPWIVVGLVAVLAIVASIIVVNLVRGGQTETGGGTDPGTQQPTEEPSTPTEPTTPTTPEEEPEEPGDEVPEVEVGQTMELQIPQWGVSGDLSGRFGSTSYVLENGNTELWLSSQLINQLPCDGNWGAVQTADGKYEVLKPAERCAAAPELYDELWGLTDAFVRSID